MKIFNTRSEEVATSCMEMFNFPLPSVCISNRKSNFLRKLSISDNIICRLCWISGLVLNCVVLLCLTYLAMFYFATLFFVLFFYFCCLWWRIKLCVCVCRGVTKRGVGYDRPHTVFFSCITVHLRVCVCARTLWKKYPDTLSVPSGNHCCTRLCRELIFKCLTRNQAKFNPLMGTLKPQSNGPLYSNTVIGTLVVDGWAVVHLV